MIKKIQKNGKNSSILNFNFRNKITIFTNFYKFKFNKFELGNLLIKSRGTEQFPVEETDGILIPPDSTPTVKRVTKCPISRGPASFCPFERKKKREERISAS